MKVFAVLLAVLMVFAAGGGLTLALWRRSPPLLATEFFGLAWLLGAGVISASLALGGIALSGAALFATVAVVALLLCALGVKRWRDGVRIETGFRDVPQWEKWFSVLAMVPILYIGMVSFRSALAWDGLLIWEAKARHAFLAGGALPAEYFLDASRQRFHPGYPLYLPFTELWIYLWVGDCDQTAGKAVPPIFFAAAMAVLWSGVRRLGGRPWMATLTALLPLFVPLMADHGHGLVEGYADFILGAVYLAGVAALLAWRFQAVEGAWPIAVACAALLPWVKQEGMLLLGSLIVQAALANGWHGWKRTVLFALPGIAILAAWKFALHSIHLVEVTDFQPMTLSTLLANLPRLKPILFAMGFELLRIESWSLLWYGVPVALLCLAWRRRSKAILLAVALLGPLLLEVVPYVFTRLDLVFHLSTSLDRLVLQLALVGAFSLGLALAATPRPRSGDEK